MNAHSTSVTFERGLSLNLISVFLNAVAMTISKFALKDVNPLITTLIICMTSTLLSLIYLRYKQIVPAPDEFKKLMPIAIINGFATILLYVSIALLDPVTVGMIGRFYVVFTTLLSTIILKERLSKSEIALIVLAILGTFLFVSPTSKTSSLQFAGVIMGLSYTFLFALANLFVKKNVQKTNSVTIMLYNNTFALGACSVLLLFFPASITTLQDIKMSTWFFAILTSSITFLGLVMFFNSFRFLSFKLSNIIRSSSPIFVALVSWPFFPIKIGLQNASGGALVLVSIVFLSLIERKK